MAIIDQLLGWNKTLSQLDRTQLRKQEILLGKQRDKLFGRIEQLTTQKQKIFDQGAANREPSLRQALAMQFELLTLEQTLAARELGTRSKELLTVARLRLMKENGVGTRNTGRLNLTDADVGKIAGWIESGSVTEDAYEQRLDMLLQTGTAADKEHLERSGLTASGQALMDSWADLDRGTVDSKQAFQQADNIVRRHLSPEPTHT